jgi:hypothetical protein
MNLSPKPMTYFWLNATPGGFLSVGIDADVRHRTVPLVTKSKNLCANAVIDLATRSSEYEEHWTFAQGCARPSAVGTVLRMKRGLHQRRRQGKARLASVVSVIVGVLMLSQGHQTLRDYAIDILTIAAGVFAWPSRRSHRRHGRIRAHLASVALVATGVLMLSQGHQTLRDYAIDILSIAAGVFAWPSS